MEYTASKSKCFCKSLLVDELPNVRGKGEAF